MKSPFFFSIALCLLFGGCIQSIAVSTVGGIVDEGFEAFTEEGDLAFAEQALPGNLKLLEVMLKNDPENARLLRLASEGYSSFALAFLEDTDPARARGFYQRGRDFGIRLLRQDEELSRALDGTPDDLKAVLKKRGPRDVPAVFWTAFGWGSSINLNLTSPDAIADLPKTEAMMQFVADTDSSYYFAGAHVFLGTLYGSRPKLLGGDLTIARKHFETALRIARGAFLMTYVYYARSVAVMAQDEAMFDEMLGKVLAASLEILPKYRLANAVAQKKAHMLLSRKSELF
jgi:hypothetical protein